MDGVSTDTAQWRLVSFFMERAAQRGEAGKVDWRMLNNLALAGSLGLLLGVTTSRFVGDDELQVLVQEALRVDAPAAEVVQIGRPEDGASSVVFSAPPNLEKVVLRAPKAAGQKAAGSKVCVDVFGLDSQEKQHALGSYEGDLGNDWAPVAARDGECTLDPSDEVVIRNFGR